MAHRDAYVDDPVAESPQLETSAQHAICADEEAKVG